MWVVDSSKFIDWMRRGLNPTRILRPFVLADQIVTCGLIRLEVIRGVVKPAAKSELTSLFDAIREVPLCTAIWQRATDLAWQLDRQGEVLPSSDLIIGACALHVGAAVVTTDKHFASIPRLNTVHELPDAFAFED